MTLRIDYRQSGGYAGLFRGCTVDAERLPAAEARELARLVEKAGIARLASAKTPNVPDLLLHDFTIDTGSGRRELSFDDLSLPETLRPLVDFLAARCRPLPPP